MPNYKICDFCGNLFQVHIKNMCNSCEKMYIQIRNIVEDRPDTIVLEISNQTGISVSRILSFANHGYFRLKEGTIEVIK